MITWLDRVARKSRGKQTRNTMEGIQGRHSLITWARFWRSRGRVVRFAKTSWTSFIAMVAPFIVEFLPPGASLTSSDGLPPPRPLGLLLTRPTANLLSEASPANFPDELWRAELGSNRAVYVDIPHGALLLNAGVNGDDVLQLRPILAAPNMPPGKPGCTLIVAQITDRGSERGRGRITGVLQPDARSGLSAASR